jgi:hypothetical protein
MPGAAIVNVTDAPYNAKGDVKATTGSINSGSTTLTVPSGLFVSGDVNKQIMVVGAGAQVTVGTESAVIPLYTTITAVGAGTVTLAASASTSVTNAVVRWGSDDTLAFQAAANALQTAGGGELRIPPATYWLYPNSRALPTGNTGLADFTSLAGVRIVGPGATLLTARAYIPPAQGMFNLFTFENCTNIEVRGLTVLGHPFRGLNLVVQNAILVHLFGACRNVDVTASCTGIVSPLMVTAGPRTNANQASDYAGDESQRSRSIRLDATAVNCGYAATFQFSGDDVRATLVTDGCARSYIAYGARAHRLMIDSKNHLNADVMLQAYQGRTSPTAPSYSGYGVENVSIDYVNRDTTATWMETHATAAVEIGFAQDYAAVHRDVRVRYDVRYPAQQSARFGPVLRVINHSSASSLNGVHGLERLRLEGRVEGPGSPFDFNQGETVVTAAGAVRGRFYDLLFADLTLASTGAAVVDLRPLASTAEFRNVASDVALPARTMGTATVRWVGCRAPSLSYTATDTLPADYEDCVIGSWADQSTLGKTFRNTTVGGYPLEIERWEGEAHRHASRFSIGDLSQWFDAFRVRHLSTGAAYRLHYYVVKAGEQDNPVNRNEIVGTATWSAFQGATGATYEEELQVAREDRMLGTGNPVVEVDLVPGSGYGTVRLRVPGWNGSTARAAFELEILGHPVRDVVPL